MRLRKVGGGAKDREMPSLQPKGEAQAYAKKKTQKASQKLYASQLNIRIVISIPGVLTFALENEYLKFTETAIFTIQFCNGLRALYLNTSLCNRYTEVVTTATMFLQCTWFFCHSSNYIGT